MEYTMLNTNLSWPKSDPKKIDFYDLPKWIQEDMIKTAQGQYRYESDKLESLIASNRQNEDLQREKVAECVKHLACKHTKVEHDKSSGITENSVACKECGFGWSDY